MALGSHRGFYLCTFYVDFEIIGGVMNMLLLWIMGFIFLTCFYGQANQYGVNWFLVFGMVFSAVVVTWILGENK